MNSFARFIAVFALIVGSTSGAVAVPPTALQPTEKWVVDFADSQCLASRNYGPPGKPLYLVLKPSPTGQVMQISVVRKAKWGDALQVPATIRFDEREPMKSSTLAFTSLKDGVRINLLNMSLEAFAPIRQAKVVAIRSAGDLNERFALAQMAPLMTAIDRCVASLQNEWNIGAANAAKFAARASANLAQHFSNEDYPSVAIQNGQSGVVGYTLLIDEGGKVADCMLVETSGAAVLDAQTCAILIERAKFKPAVGTDGKPAKDSVVGRVRWMVRKSSNPR